MPVSVVCESSANVSAALRESLSGVGSGICSSAAAATADDAKTGASSSSAMTSGGGGGGGGGGSSNDNSTDIDTLHGKLVASTKRVLLTKIEYEEVNNYNQSVLEAFKSKYTVLKPSGANNNNGNGNIMENGRASPATCNNNNNNSNGMNGINGSAADTNGNTLMKRPNSNPNELPAPKRVLFPREDVRIGWKGSSRKWQIGVGMMNVGNTCYLNSTLQAIFHVPAMANWLMSDAAHREQCDAAEATCIICAMAKTLIASQSSQSAIRPYFVYSKLKSICKHLVMGRQEDAHEFLRYLVEAMEKSYLTRFRNFKDLDQYSKETTPLNQILGGYLRSAVRCLACNHVSVTFQHFEDLLLDIRKADTIDEALEGYFSRERLEDMGYKCESCKKKVSATKQFSLERAPIALCIQLKRFSMLGTKLNKQITIKPRLDLTKFASRKHTGEQLTYKLVAMVTHLGASQHCGHYTAIGLTESGTYYNYDDSYVRPISIQNVCNTNAYIIFYEMDQAPMTARQVTSTQVHNDSKENYQRVNGYLTSNNNNNNNNNSNNNSQRIIGPQLPSTGLNSYSSSLANKSSGVASPYTNGGSKLTINRQGGIPTNNNNNNNSKIMIHFKNNNNNNSNNSNTIKSNACSSSSMATTTTATATSSTQNGSGYNNNNNNNNNSNNNNTTTLQNGLLTGTGKFQENTNAQSQLVGATNKTKNFTISNGNENNAKYNGCYTINSTAATATTTTTTLNGPTNNDYEVSSSTSERKGNNNYSVSTSTTKTATLPSMPKLYDTVNNSNNSNNNNNTINGNCNNHNSNRLQQKQHTLCDYNRACLPPTTINNNNNNKNNTLNGAPKSLVPYESETDDDEATTVGNNNNTTTTTTTTTTAAAITRPTVSAAVTSNELKRVKCNSTSGSNNNNSGNKQWLKRHNSSSSDNDDYDDDDDNHDAGVNDESMQKLTNGVKVKKATTSSNNNNKNTNITTTTTATQSKQQQQKQKSDDIDAIFNFNKRNNCNGNGNVKKYKQTTLCTATTTTTTSGSSSKNANKINGRKKLSSNTSDNDDDDYDDCDDDADDDDNTASHMLNGDFDARPPFKRAHSTPPSPPIIKTKTGYWQVTTLKPPSNNNKNNNNNKNTSSSATTTTPTPITLKNPKNPFAAKTPELLAKRAKLLHNEKSEKSRNGSGYQRDTASDSAVNELLKQSHRGYGAPVLSWNGDKTEIEKELAEEAREQRQRDWEDEQENEMDRGRQKKVKSSKENNNSAKNRTPGFNPFQEQENQRRWKHGHGHGSGGGGHHQQRFHGGHFRHQFQRNKFKFQRFNHRFQRTHYQRNSNNNSNGGRNGNGNGSGNNNSYNRRDS